MEKKKPHFHNNQLNHFFEVAKNNATDFTLLQRNVRRVGNNSSVRLDLINEDYIKKSISYYFFHGRIFFQIRVKKKKIKNKSKPFFVFCYSNKCS